MLRMNMLPHACGSQACAVSMGCLSVHAMGVWGGGTSELVAVYLSAAPMCRPTRGASITSKYFAFIILSFPTNRLSADLSALYHPNTILGCWKSETHHKSQDWLEPGDF